MVAFSKRDSVGGLFQRGCGTAYGFPLEKFTALARQCLTAYKIIFKRAPEGSQPGRGYSETTAALLITTGVIGTSSCMPFLPVGTAFILLTTGIPLTTLPNTV